MIAVLVLYATMVVAAGFQEEFAPLAGALAAHHGHGEVWLVALACAAGSWLHGIVLYQIGHHGRGVLVKRGLARPVALIHAHRVRAMLASRFAYGLRITLPVACGAARIPLSEFAMWTAASSAAWAALFTAVGWVAGELAVTLLSDIRRYELPAGGALLALGVGFWLWRRRRTRRMDVT